MKIFQENEYFKKYSPLFVGLIGLMLIYKLLDNLGIVFSSVDSFFKTVLEVMMPILIGVIVAYLLFKPMHGVEKFIFKYIRKSQNKPRAVRLISIVLIYALTFALIIVFFNAAIPSIVESLSNLITQMPVILEIINDFLGENISQGGAAQEILTSLKEALDYLQNMSTIDMMNYIAASFGISSSSFLEIGNAAFLVIKSTFSFVVSFFIVFFIGLYTMLDKEKIIEQIKRFLKVVLNEKIFSGLQWAVLTIDDIFYKYFSGKFFTSLFIGFLFYLGLLVINVDYAPLFALIVGVFNMIPYFGPIIGAVPAILITLIDDPVKALWVGILILVVQQFDGNVLAPNVLGKIVELNPFWVLVSVVVGGSMFGVLGMFVAIPMFAVIKVFLEAWMKRYEKKKEMLLIEKENEKG